MRLVKSAAAKRVPATRRWSSAWEETSIAQAASPASRMRANSACSSIASGVVWATGIDRARRRAPRSCRSARSGRPAASSTARSRKAEVVLPLVPVTPTTVEARPTGRPDRRRRPAPSPGGRRRRRPGAPAGRAARSTSSAAAPRATASAAKSCPSARTPRTAQKSAPGAASSGALHHRGDRGSAPAVAGAARRADARPAGSAPDELAEGHAGRDATTGAPARSGGRDFQP